MGKIGRLQFNTVCIKDIASYLFAIFFVNSCIFDHMYFTQIDIGFVIILQDIFWDYFLDVLTWK